MEYALWMEEECIFKLKLVKSSMVNSKITGFNMVIVFINHQYILVPLNLKELFLTMMDLDTEHWKFFTMLILLLKIKNSNYQEK